MSNRKLRNVTYYGDWSIWEGQGNFYPNAVPGDQLTHLNFAFLDFDSEGNLKFTDPDAATEADVGDGVGWNNANSGLLMALQLLRAKNPNLKVGASLGGWSKSGDFSVVAADSQKRARFVENVMKFIEYTNMDFVDVDWEFPGDVRQPDLVDNKHDEGTPNSRPQDKANYIILLQDFRRALDRQGERLGKYYELSVAIPAPKSKVDIGIDVKGLFDVVDFANIMTYDMRGAWDEYTGHHTGLYTNPYDPLKGNCLSVDESVKYYMEQGAPAEKIVIGAAYYSRGWNRVRKGTDPDSNNPGLFGVAEVSSQDADGTPSRGAMPEGTMQIGDAGRATGTWSYRRYDELKRKFPGLKEYWDDVAKAPYLYDESTGLFYTYDNVRSIEEKVKYVHQHNLGGVISWMSSQDAPTTGSARDELTKATKNALFGSAKLEEHEIVYTPLNVQVTNLKEYEEWGQKKLDITIKNAEVTNETNGVLKGVESGAKTIKLPKLYIKGTAKFTGGDYRAGAVTYENGYTVVDPATQYDGKWIKHGSEFTFTLHGDAQIESIELVQRISSNGPDMNRQVIYGKVTDTNTAPILHGVTDRTIFVGDAFDAMAGVTETDKEDGNLTHKIVVSGHVDTTRAGVYELTYSVTDNQGLSDVKVGRITVINTNTAPILHGVTDRTIFVGDAFDAMAGVTATDKEDGNLTHCRHIEGSCIRIPILSRR